MTTSALAARVQSILDAAQQRINEDGYDPATVLGGALEALAEQWAENAHPVCPSCSVRRCGRNQPTCGWCAEAERLDQHHKLEYWHNRKPKRITDANGRRVYVDRDRTAADG